MKKLLALLLTMALVFPTLASCSLERKECQHKWNDATCTTAKTCSLCGETEGDPAGHTGGAATCTQKAVCSVCGEAYGETVAHVYNQTVANEKTLKSPATATSAAVYYKSCVCGTVSKNAADTFTQGEPAPHEHSFSDKWSYDGENHWRDCDCGEKADVAPHSFGEGSESGVCSVCGLTVTKPADPNNPGNNTPNAPSNPDNPDDPSNPDNPSNPDDPSNPDNPSNPDDPGVTDCDHTVMEEKVLFFQDIGCCKGSLYYESCACGEVLRFDIDAHDVNLTCPMTYEHEESVDENGNEIYVVSGSCPDCGLVIHEVNRYDIEGCTGYERWVITLTKGGAVILENLIQEDAEYYHDYVEQEVDISACGACQDTLRVGICSRCGEYNLDDFDFEQMSCVFTDEPVVEERVDENGFVHEITTYSCVNCGIKTSEEEWIEFIKEPCEGTYHAILSMTCGDTVLGETHYSEYDSYHDYELSGTQLGAVCADGIEVTYRCADCGDSFTRIRYDHAYDSEYISLRDYGLCDGDIYVNRCVGCGDVGSVSVYDYACDWDPVETLDDGTQVYSCSRCNAVKHYAYTETDKDENCAYTYNRTYVYFVNGEEVYRAVETGISSDHEYLYDYVMDGDTCADGYTVNESCANCDYTDSYHTSGHATERVETDLSELGLCGGYIAEEVCVLCGEVTYVYVGDYDCYWVMTEELDDGYAYTCRYCGAVKHELYSETDKDENCAYTYTETYVYFVNGEEVYRVEYTDTAIAHEYVYDYVMDGATCDDGYTVNESCADCGYTYSYHTSGHDTEYVETDLSELGLCGGYIEERVCVICGEVTDVYVGDYDCYWEMTEELDGGYAYICRYCGAVKHELYSETDKDENCAYTYTETYVYFVNGEEVYRVEYTDTAIAHKYVYDYVMDGDTCADGYTVIETCADCDYTYSYHTSGHNTEYAETDLSELGLCGGYVEQAVCRVCGEVTYARVNDYACKWEQTEELDGGYAYTCSTCGVVKHEIYSKTEKDENCAYTYTQTYVYFVNGEEVYRVEYTGTSSDHEYLYDYVMDGDTCADGYTAYVTCADCDYSDEWHSYGHNTQRTETDLSDFGLCGGYARKDVCVVCGEVTYVYVGDYYCDWEETETIENGTVYTCSTCGAVKHETYTETDKDENCKYTYNRTYVYFVNGEEVYRVEYTGTDIAHEYLRDYVMDGDTCADGYTVIDTCADCDYTDSYHTSGHDTEYVTTDLSELGLCGGYIEGYECDVCGEVTNFNTHEYCEWEETGTIENGYAYTCVTCGAVKHETYTESEKDENCEILCVTSNVYFVNGEEVFRCEQTISYVQHDNRYEYVMDGATCDEGYTVNESCADCDYTRSYHTSGHAIESVETDLSELGLCGGYAWKDVCVVCGEVTDAYVGDYYCDWVETETIENGYAYTCQYCGAVKHETYTEGEKDENCEYPVNYTWTYFVNGEEVYHCERAETNTRHEHHYEYVMDGATCDDGYTVIETCADCDYSGERYDYGHRDLFGTTTVNLADLGLCEGGYVEMYECDVCGEAIAVSWQLGGVYDLDTEASTENLEVRHCYECGGTVHFATDIYGNMTLTFFRDGEELLSVTSYK